MRTIVVTLCLMATGCASITAGTTESVAVSTVPAAAAKCDLVNEKGHWSVNPTPGSTTVTKAYGDLTVTCSDPQGDQGTATLQSHTAGAAFGNILLGGIIGAAVDMSSGTAYLYPSTATVALTPAPAHTVAAPAAPPDSAKVGKPTS